MIKELEQKIMDAEYVLVGIGEEFQVDYKEIMNIPEFSHVLKQSQKDEALSWVQPYLIHEYIRTGNFEKYREAYENLSKLLNGKDYQIISTCTDDLIYQSSLEKDRIVTPCGTFYQMQCEKNCGGDVEDGENVAFSVTKDILTKQDDLKSVIRPICENCGGHFVFNTIFEENYDENGYKEAWNRYSGWLQKTVNRKLVILELGVGMTYPSVIRFPFEKTSYFNKKSTFYRINEGIYQLSEQTEKRGAGINENAVTFLKRMF